jgi:hypothetical protein
MSFQLFSRFSFGKAPVHGSFDSVAFLDQCGDLFEFPGGYRRLGIVSRLLIAQFLPYSVTGFRVYETQTGGQIVSLPD